MKRFTKYFGGIYMKYWYIGAVLIAVLMIGSLMNDKYIKGYKLTIYSPDGKELSSYDLNSATISNELEAVKEISPNEFFTGGDVISNQLVRLPITKKFVPVKTL